MDDPTRQLAAKSDALRLLSFKPRSVEELRARLAQKKKYTAETIEEVIALLTRQGLLDDVKFAKLYAHSRVHTRPAGRRQIELDLKKKGLGPELVAKTLGELGDYDEKQAAKDLVSGRFQKMTGVSAEKKKARLFGFLARRGFKTDVILSALSELFHDLDG
ncbi:MAG: regulatory protein RecX [Candidatus Omnitrophica bacterium]|nr:regulatory protein RecX [Candidatus Omnitrophota bacterium]